jgi:hypothetical protein
MNISRSTLLTVMISFAVLACSQSSGTSSTDEGQNLSENGDNGSTVTVVREGGVLQVESATAVIQPLQPGNLLDMRLTASVVFLNACFVPSPNDLVRVVQTTDTGLRVDLVTVTSKNCTDERAPVTRTYEVLHRAFARLSADTPRVELNGFVAKVESGG